MVTTMPASAAIAQNRSWAGSPGERAARMCDRRRPERTNLAPSRGEGQVGLGLGGIDSDISGPVWMRPSRS